MAQSLKIAATSVFTALLAIVCAGLFPGKAESRGGLVFSCEERNGYYETYVERNDPNWGDARRVFVWSRPLGGVPVEDRCQQVTGRLQEAYNNGLSAVTHGILNNNPVICAVPKGEEDCQQGQLLYTLDWASDDPVEELENLLLMSESDFMQKRPLRQAQCQVIVDLDKLADNDAFAVENCN